MTDPQLQEAVEAVIRAGRHAAQRGWVPATAGNFSVRCGEHIAITRTGRDKGNLTPADVAVIALGDFRNTAGASRPQEDADRDLSAETLLHLTRYQADSRIGALSHVHCPVAAVLARRHERDGEIVLQGWELQKAFAGVASHLLPVRVPVLSNDQSIARLASAAEVALRQSFEGHTAPGYVVAGHGLNTWGRDPTETQRHLEAFEALLTLHLRWSELDR